MTLCIDLNERYLWAVNNLKNLLKNHKGLLDFPGTYEPYFEDVMPSSVMDVDWEYMVAPAAEQFLSTVQRYVMTKGTYPPEEGTAAWIFVETFKSSVNEAIQVGEAYSKRMAQEFQKMMRAQRQPSVTKVGAPSSNQASSIPDGQPQSAPISAQTQKQSATQSATSAGVPSTTIPGTQRSILAGNTCYTGVPLADIISHLREWEKNTKRSCAFLREKQNALEKAQADIPQEMYDQAFESAMIEWEGRKKEKAMSPEMAEMTRPFLAKYSDIIGFIATIIINYERFALEFARLIQELPRGVKESHAEALRQILWHCDRLTDRCRDFRVDYVNRGPWTDIASAVYNEVLEAHGDFMDLGNVAVRLHALVGSTLESATVPESTRLKGDAGEGKSVANSWDGLQIEEAFEPRLMVWNGQPFVIEEPAQCYKGYDLEEQSLEDYFPELHEDWNRYIKDVPFDEVENLRLLRLVGLEKTILIHVMLKDSVAVYPDQLESSGATNGWHEGGLVLVAGRKFAIKGVRVEPTDEKVQATIAANRRGRKPVAVKVVASGETMSGSETGSREPKLDDIHAAVIETKELVNLLHAGKASDVMHKDLKNHIDKRFDTLGHEFSAMQCENAELKQNLAQVLSNLAQKVEPEFFQWIFAILGAGSVNAAAKKLGMPGSTFADKVKEYAGRGGVYKTLFSMVAVRNKGAGRRQIERFNELFSEHQGAQVVAQPEVLRELLEGLEALNASNWKGMRDELIAIVRGELPEG